MSESVHFKIIVPMYQCKAYAVKCLDSIRKQNYSNWQAIICVEPCLDNTLTVVQKYLDRFKDDRFVLVQNTERKGVPRNHVECIRLSKPQNDDVIILVDGDDTLYGEDVFSYLNTVYEDQDVWITWGSYMFADTKRRGRAAQPVPKKDPRKGKRWWRYSHLKTFQYFLFKGIRDKDLREKKTGKYYTVAGDMALMFPMIEMAGEEHRKFLDKVLYVYNLLSPYNDEKIHYARGRKCDLEIRTRSQYPAMMKEELCAYG